MYGTPPQEPDWGWHLKYMAHHNTRRDIQSWKHIYPRCPEIPVPNIWTHCALKFPSHCGRNQE